MSMVDKVKNALQKVRGRGKRTTGRATGNRDLEAKGAAEKAGGSVKQAGENVKDTFK
jgi:uncharacterized protein YjbJ (UPF0337 family)